YISCMAYTRIPKKPQVNGKSFRAWSIGLALFSSNASYLSNIPRVPRVFSSTVRLGQDRRGVVLASGAVRVSERHHILQWISCQQKSHFHVRFKVVYHIDI
ncbi:MAG TPA: hypothetical protein VLQ80_03630, partial [Candidatus Saccharimonadia bacterium]|nr:hypothetical protein [Candidatus Saccharimonadia bacterium]